MVTDERKRSNLFGNLYYYQHPTNVYQRKEFALQEFKYFELSEND